MGVNIARLTTAKGRYPRRSASFSAVPQRRADYSPVIPSRSGRRSADSRTPATTRCAACSLPRPGSAPWRSRSAASRKERMLNLRPHRRLARLGRLFGDALAHRRCGRPDRDHGKRRRHRRGRFAGLYRSKHADFHGPATKAAKVGVLPRAFMALSPDFFVTSISRHSRRTSATVFSAAGPSGTRFARLQAISLDLAVVTAHAQRTS